MSQNSNVIYSCIYGGYENLREHEYREPDTDYVIFTDDPNMESDFFDIRYVPCEDNMHGARFHKRMKCMPHIWLKEYNEDVFVGMTVTGLESGNGAIVTEHSRALWDNNISQIRLDREVRTWKDNILTLKFTH